MIGFLLGLLVASAQTAGLYVMVPFGWHPLIGFGLIVYLLRFDLRRVAWGTTAWLGLWLDVLSSWRFGSWLLICLIAALIADHALPARAGNARDPLSLYVTFGLVFVVATISSAISGSPWLGSSLGSATLVTLLYYGAVRLTIRWRLYE